MRLVGADREQAHAAGVERRLVSSQLTELVFAPRSPIAAIEHEHDRPARELIGERDCVAHLIRQRESRRLRAVGDARLVRDVQSGHAGGSGEREQRVAHVLAYHTAMIVVTGASGNIGRPLVHMLRAAGQSVRVLARDPARATKLLGPDVVVADATSADAFAGATKAFLLDHAGPELGAKAAAFAGAAKAAGVAHVVAISSGTIAMVPPTAIGGWHAELERAIEASGVAWTFLRPGNFASNALRWAPMIRASGRVFAAKPDGASAPIDPHDIAAVACAALTGRGHEGNTYTIMGPAAMTAREQVAVIAAGIDRPIEVVEVSVEQARAGMVKGGMPELIANSIIDLLGRSDPQLTTTVQDVTGVAPRAFAQWVHAQRHAFA